MQRTVIAFASLFFAGALWQSLLPGFAPGMPVKTEMPLQRFSEHLIADNYGYTFGLAAVDVDADGDLDLTSANIRNKSHSTLSWFENDGQGSFHRQVIHQNEPGWFERHAIGDINGDRRPDVAIVNNLAGQLVWFANRARPAEGPWMRYVITTKHPKAYDVALSDLDGDGDLDAAASGYTGNLVAWYENPGAEGWDGQWKQWVIDDGMAEARTIAAADFNRDGKIDLLATAVGKTGLPAEVSDPNEHGSQVVWFENTGRPAPKRWIKRIIDDRSRAAIHGHPADFDRDGDLDVIMAYGMRIDADPKVDRHRVVWYENTGDPTSAVQWKSHQVGLLPFAFEAIAADLDNDDDVDVIATAWSKGDRVVWFENSGDPRGDWSRHTVRENFRAANQVIAADLNGDGLLDLASTSDDGSRRVQGSLELRWWRNEGKRAR